ncbi:MAG: hypothetical protein SFU86_07240 [Pirellulaceae bacterium]|nr:hypothetical protein [Pirellulaceae bacterium]
MPSSLKPARDSGLRIRIAPEDVTLRSWPLVDQPLGSLLAIALAAGGSGLVGWRLGRWEAGLAAAVLLGLSLVRVWLPVRYELNSGGVIRTVFGWRRRIAWSAIRGYEQRLGGVLLLADAPATPLSPLRGLYIPWGRHRDSLLAACEYYLGHA